MAAKLHKLRLSLINGCSVPLVTGLLDDLLDERILSNAEVEYINEAYNLCRDKMRTLVDTVRKKGDRSSEFLIQKVSERDLMLSEKLGITVKLPLSTEEQNASTASQPESSESPLPSVEKKPIIKTEIKGIRTCSEEDFKRITAEEKIYSIGKPEERTRLALVICNEKFDDSKLRERNGAEFDADGMENLLNGFGYKVQVKRNLTVEEMRNTMKAFSQEEDHKTSDSTFIVIMSHGLRDRICGTNTHLAENEEPKKVLHIDEVFNTFNNVNCRALENKPKVIIFQACRGHEDSKVWVSDGACDSSDDHTNLEEDAQRKIQKERDFACFCSTTPDTVSWRDPKRGSLFILRLIEHMKADAYRYSIGEIFQNVQLSFKDKEQMPTLERTTLLKKFYLFPGH